MLSGEVRENREAGRRLLEQIGKKPVLFDGGMGSQLQARGMKPGELPEVMNVLHSDWVIDIQSEYLAAGSQCILTNTLGTNRFHMEGTGYSIREAIEAAIQNGREAIRRETLRCERAGIQKECFLIFDIGSLGVLMQPSGTLSFEEAYDAFREQIEIAKNLVDGVLIETVSDLYEMKSAILAVKETCDLPIFASMTFSGNEKTMMGATPETCVTFMESIGADVVGVNCSLGPKEMVPIVRRILNTATRPVIVQPNAGLPVYKENQTYYNVTVDEFSRFIREFVENGVAVVGGCCGTTPNYIRQTAELLRNVDVGTREIIQRTRITSGSECVTFGDSVKVCGERLNPTGKKKMKEALLSARYDEVLLEAIAQEQAGADILDVNVGLPGIDEPAVMVHIIKKLQEILSLPLQIDSSDPIALEKACRIYNGKPLINSVNGKEELMHQVFPIVKKYGGVILGLTLDEKGIPPKAEDRLAIARRIIKTAESYGIERKDVMIDCLVLTASAQQKEVSETLKALSMVKKELGVHTVLGLSNVSFGLPNRPLINKTFLAMALYAGLDMPIMNPLDPELMSIADAAMVLTNSDQDSIRYIERHASDATQTGSVSAPKTSRDKSESVVNENMGIRELVVTGMKGAIGASVKTALITRAPLEIISEELVPGLDEVGRLYESGKLFLPQLILSAETTKIAFSVLKEAFPSAETDSGKGPIVLATVECDIHDIGKNIVRVIMESYGFAVIDLGKDVPAEKVVEAFHIYRPKAIGLSALMTTTVASMKSTIDKLHEIPGICPILVGGAVVTQEVADEIGAEYYTKDALSCVELVQRILDSQN